MARRSSSRSVVSSISGPSVLNEKRTLCFLKVSMYSPSSSASFTTFVSRFEEGQISSKTPRSARRLQRSRSCAAWMPWPMRSGSRYRSTSSTLSQSSSSPACTAVPLHRVVAQLEGCDIGLAVGPADHLIDGLLDRERARLDQLGPAVKRQEILE